MKLKEDKSNRLKLHRRAKYGLETYEVDEWIEAQGGVCPICQIEPENVRGWHVDHDHYTDEVRGMLCSKCNMGLGLFKDDPERLYRAAAYLNKDLENLADDTYFSFARKTK